MWNFKGTLWNSTQNSLPIHWKMWFLYNIAIIRALRFKSSYAFLKRPPGNYLSMAWSKLIPFRKHDDVIKWKHFQRHWPFVREIHRSPVNSPHKGQWRGALMFSLICACINGWVNNREAGELRRHRAHYDVIAMMHPELWPREQLVQ